MNGHRINNTRDVIKSMRLMSFYPGLINKVLVGSDLKVHLVADCNLFNYFILISKFNWSSQHGCGQCPTSPPSLRQTPVGPPTS